MVQKAELSMLFPLFPKPAIRAKRVIRGLLQVLVPFRQRLAQMLAQMLMAASQQLKLRQMVIILRKNYILILTICAELHLHPELRGEFCVGVVIIQHWQRLQSLMWLVGFKLLWVVIQYEKVLPRPRQEHRIILLPL